MIIRKFYTFYCHEMRKRAVKEFIKNTVGKKILDIGSGKGFFNSIFRQIGFRRNKKVNEREMTDD